MQILTDASSIHDCLKGLIQKATAIEGAAAWASIGFDAYDLLFKHRKKIRRLIVGMHFHQTHPDFIEAYLNEQTVKFSMSTDGTFHPKAYLFEMPGSEWKCLVGSANFTRSAMENNQEMAVLIESHDPGAAHLKKEILASIKRWWVAAKYMDHERLEYYRTQWVRNRIKNARRAGTFGKVTASEVVLDRGVAAIDIPIIRMKWKDFYSCVRKERFRGKPTLVDRLAVLRGVRQLFVEHSHFNRMPKGNQYEIGGLVRDSHSDFGWFGSMWGAWQFKSVVSRNDKHISRALDTIPNEGKIERDDYVAFIDEYKKAFPNGGSGIATSTRLLAMKRPDVFVCLGNRNKRLLCKSFGIPQNVDYEMYWDSIIERIQASTWWNSERPTSDQERSVWEGRAAFLDALFFKRR